VDDCKIKDLNHYLSLWKEIYSSPGAPSWDHLLPYYDENIFFKDTVQKIRGIRDFKAMTERLSKRSKKPGLRHPQQRHAGQPDIRGMGDDHIL
jgi:hypothetical protein